MGMFAEDIGLLPGRFFTRALEDSSTGAQAYDLLFGLFRAFGHAGVRQAGATLEQRIKKQDAKGTAFADLMWKPRLPDRDEEDRGRPGAGVPPGV